MFPFEVILFNQSTSVDTETIEFAPFLADGETPNPDAVRFNINAFSRTYPDQFNPSGTLLIQREVEAVSIQQLASMKWVDSRGRSLSPVVGILEIVGSFEQPFDAFSLLVYLKSEVSDFVVSVNPGEDPEAMLVFGRDDAVPHFTWWKQSIVITMALAKLYSMRPLTRPGSLDLIPQAFPWMRMLASLP